MVDLKRLKVVEAKLRIARDLVVNLEREVDFLKESHYRDMRDKWQYAKDIGHPVTGRVSPEESAELLVMSLCNRDRGC